MSPWRTVRAGPTSPGGTTASWRPAADRTRPPRRVLATHGWFAFVIAHPCFLAPDVNPTTSADGRRAVAVTGYFDERFWRSSNPCGVRRPGNHHRTISTYLNALARHGFVIEATDEPRAGHLLAQQQPLYAHVPMFFGCRVRRT